MLLKMEVDPKIAKNTVRSKFLDLLCLKNNRQLGLQLILQKKRMFNAVEV